ncbi:MAG: hypothetical protein ACOYT8_01855 [Candidatus Dependentiae bacterium]
MNRIVLPSLLAIIITLGCSVISYALMIEYCANASNKEFFFELKNKSNQDVEFILYVDYIPITHSRIKKMRSGKTHLIRIGDIEAENSLSLKIWPVGQYYKSQHYQFPLDKTIYIKYKNNVIQPQKGSAKGRTKSGLSLANNISDKDIMRWQPTPPKF